MKKITKVLLVLLVALMMLPLTVSAVSDNETMSNNLSITISTDKNEYKVTNVAKITATITNTGSEDIENVTAQAVFDDLSPVSAKNSETNKTVTVLKPRESFSFSYKATLNSSKHNLNFFQKIILFIVRFFNGSYTANSIDFDVITENVTDIKFGKFTAENIVQVGYSVSDDSTNDDVSTNNTWDYTVDENHVVITDEKGNGYVNNMIIVLSNIHTKEEELEFQMCLEKINGIIVGKSDDVGGMYQIEIPTANRDKIEEMCNYLETSELVWSAHLNETMRYEIDTETGISNMSQTIPNDPWKDTIQGGFGVDWDETCPDGYNWWIETIEAPSAWDYNEYFSNIKIGIVDSGFDAQHEDLEITVLNNNENYPDNHGTHVTGIIGATANNGIGITGIVWNKELLCADVEANKTQYKENVSIWNDYDGIYQVLKEGAKVVNFSRGTTLDDNSDSIYNSGWKAANAILWYKEQLNRDDFIIVDSAGNDNIDAVRGGLFCSVTNDVVKKYFEENKISEYTYNDIIEHIIVVGAIEKQSSSYSMTDFSNYGSQISISAPGKSIFSTIVSGGLDGNYGDFLMDGTSMATPMVTGVASLVWSVNPDFTAKEVKEIVCNYTNKTATGYGDDTRTYPIVNAKLAVKEAIRRTDLSETTITGTVTDSITGKPIPNVWVEATDNNDPVVSISDFTDENGHYSIPLESGSYVVGYSHNDYKVEVRDVDVGEQNPNIDIKLTPLNSSDIEDDTDDYYTVTYTVIDISTFDHISGVSVNVTKQYDETGKIIATATTDTNGSFTLKLPGGDYVLLFSHEDYETKDALRIINSDVDDGLIYLTPLEKRAEIASGDCGADGDNIKWVLYDDGELVISGSGKMTDYDWWSDTPWRSNKNSITAVTMSDDITYIGKYAFGECEKLKNVKLPQKLESIGESAFYHCHGIVQIDFPDSLRNIGKKAFWNSNGLEKVYIHQNIKNIGEEAFHACHKLKLIIVDKNNKYYLSDEYGVLFDKNKETLIQYPLDSDNTTYSIPSSVKTIGVGAFSGGKNLKNINIPIGVETIEDDAFSSCDSLVTIDIPHTVKKLGKKIFYSCENLTSIKVPNTITIIEEYSFTDCKNLVNIEIPDSINQIRWHAFEGTAYYNDPKNWNNGSLYLGNHLIKVDSSVSGSYVIKEGTLTIADKAFENCSDITEISFPDTLVYIGEWSFSFCSGLTSITIPSSVTFIGDVAFNSCTNLTNVIFEDGIGSTTIGEFSFQDCKNIENIVFGDTVENIEWYAFCHCTNIKSITISTSLKNVANSVFYNSNTSIDIYYKGSQEQWDEINIGYNNYYLTNSTIHYNS